MLETGTKPRSLSRNKQNPVELLREIEESGRAVTLAINDDISFLVRDSQSYRLLIELVERLEAIEGIRRGIDSFERGEGRPAREVLEEIRRKYAIPHE